MLISETYVYVVVPIVIWRMEYVKVGNKDRSAVDNNMFFLFAFENELKEWSSCTEIYAKRSPFNNYQNICTWNVATVVCPPGYYGMNCSSQCPFPSFGVLCSDTCLCNVTECNHVNGCRSNINTEKRITVGKYANRITTIECLLHET